jgi:hypothetical protein
MQEKVEDLLVLNNPDCILWTGNLHDLLVDFLRDCLVRQRSRRINETRHLRTSKSRENLHFPQRMVVPCELLCDRIADQGSSR